MSDYEDGNHRTPLAELNAALAAAQGEFPSIPKTKEVEVKTKTGGSYSYSYAPLETILGAVRPTLTKYGLALAQIPEDIGNGPALRTELRHKGGGLISGSFPLLGAPDNMQALGSALTYIRRYAVVAILGIATEEDDDGRRASEAKPEMVDRAQHARMAILIKQLNEKAPPTEGQLDWKQQMRDHAGVKSATELSHAQADEAIKWLEGQLEAAGIPF